MSYTNKLRREIGNIKHLAEDVESGLNILGKSYRTSLAG